MSAVVYRARVRISKQQSTKRALSLVEPQHCPVNLQKKRLRQILSLGFVAENGVSDPEHLLPMPVEENQKSLLASFRDFATQCLVRARPALGCITRAREIHFCLSRRSSTNSSNGLSQDTVDAFRLKALRDLSAKINPGHRLVQKALWVRNTPPPGSCSSISPPLPKPQYFDRFPAS